ncbi:MAG: TlpA disulfide reductase family protein [Acidobacteriaceae bacterium]
MPSVRVFCALLFCLPLTAQVFPTGHPIKPPSGGAMLPLTPVEYQKFATANEGYSFVKVIRKLPTNLSPDYRLGYNFIYESDNHGWILDRDSEGYKLFLDLKGDGDLSSSQPFRFHEEGGVPRIDVPMKDGASPWVARFELVQSPGGAAVRINLESYRNGKILLDGHEIPFRLSGSSGRYGLPGDQVSFDREGNGKYESYWPGDRWVNLAGRTYEFHVDPHGGFLTLKESDSRPDRPSLKPGSPIPDVSLTDLKGKPHAFRHNTADFTLLEFWDTHCGPCREEMPKLKVLYDRLPRSRFDILGVSSDESEEVLKKYLAEFAIAWPECREPFEGRVHRLLRIDGEPTYFLLSRNGEILDHWVGSGSTIPKIEAKLK